MARFGSKMKRLTALLALSTRSPCAALLPTKTVDVRLFDLRLLRSSAAPRFAANSDETGQTGNDDSCELGDYCDVPDEVYAGSSQQSLLNNDLSQRLYEISLKNWEESSPRERKYKTTKPIILDNHDRIRKIAMHHYPLAVFGGTSGSLYLVDLNRGEILDSVENAHDPVGPSENRQVKKALALKEGFFVGKGIVAIAMQGNQVVTAGREGGARAWKITGSNKLALQGTLHVDTIVTCIQFDAKQRLWTGSYDGVLRIYSDLLEDKPITHHSNSPIVDLCLSDELSCGACAHSSGEIQLFDLAEGMTLTSLQTFRNGVIPKSVLLMRDHEGTGKLVCGGSNGSLVHYALHLDDDCVDMSKALSLDYAECEVDTWNPVLLDEDLKLKPAHRGPIVCLESPHEGMFLSAAQDGTVKVWACNQNKHESPIFGPPDKHLNVPKCRFTLKGHTPYVSNLCTDGMRLISDGCKNKIFMRDFSMQMD